MLSCPRWSKCKNDLFDLWILNYGQYITPVLNKFTSVLFSFSTKIHELIVTSYFYIFSNFRNSSCCYIAPIYQMMKDIVCLLLKLLNCFSNIFRSEGTKTKINLRMKKVRPSKPSTSTDSDPLGRGKEMIFQRPTKATQRPFRTMPLVAFNQGDLLPTYYSTAGSSNKNNKHMQANKTILYNFIRVTRLLVILCFLALVLRGWIMSGTKYAAGKTSISITINESDKFRLEGCINYQWMKRDL